MSNEIKVGDCVVKKSGKPFKRCESEEEAFKFDYVEGFEVNPQDPKGRMGARLKLSQTVVNLHMIKKEKA